MVSSCCCMSLQKGVKIVAIISLIWSIALIAEEIFVVVFQGCDGILVIKRQNPEFGSIASRPAASPSPPPVIHRIAGTFQNGTEGHSPGNKTHIITPQDSTLVGQLEAETAFCELHVSDAIISGLWVLTWIGDIALAIMLIVGAYKQSIKWCAVWFHIRCALLVFRVIFFIIYLIADLRIVYKIPVIVLCIFRAYSLWVVHDFINELKVEKVAKTHQRVSVTSPRASKTDLEKFSAQSNTVNPGGTPLW